MPFSVSSVFTLTGDETKTLHALTNVAATGNNDISSLSTNNYPNSGDSNPNHDNQLVFMNQPLSWWLASLNSGSVKYTPVSNFVNWSYVEPSSKALIHIGITISNLLMPNKTQKVDRTPGSRSSVITFEPKFGLGRVDTCDM